MITINLDDSYEADVSFLEEYYPYEYGAWLVNVPLPDRPPLGGGIHYKLLNYLANLYEGATILDAGTYVGMSCMALANSPNKVITYEINGGYGIQKWCRGLPQKNPDGTLTENDGWRPAFMGATETGVGKYANTTFKLLDVNKETDENLKKVDFIFLDIDLHDGIQEAKLFATLRRIGYKGIVVADDIHLNEGMRDWWSSIPERKWDVTKYGHGSGTGLVDFGNIKEVIGETTLTKEERNVFFGAAVDEEGNCLYSFLGGC